MSVRRFSMGTACRRLCGGGYGACSNIPTPENWNDAYGIVLRAEPGLTPPTLLSASHALQPAGPPGTK